MEVARLLACYSLLQYYLFTLAFSLPLFISSQKQMTHRAKEELMPGLQYCSIHTECLAVFGFLVCYRCDTRLISLSLYPLALELYAICDLVEHFIMHTSAGIEEGSLMGGVIC